MSDPRQSPPRNIEIAASLRSMKTRLIFIGLSGKEYPHTRVRCYNFARILRERYGVPTEVLSFKEDLAQGRSEADMYEALRDRDKLWLTLKALRRLWATKGSVFYLQKAHFHAAAPYFLHRLGRNNYILDYDDYDIPLSNFFFRGRYNRLWFGTNRWDEITFRLSRRALRCVVSSHYLLEFLRPHHSSVHLVETGVDTTQFSPPETPPPADPLRFFWNGIVWGEPVFRNVRFAFDCFRKVHQAYPRTELLIAAQGAWMDRVKSQLQAAYSYLPIRILDWMKPESMPDLLRSVHVGLLPLVQKDPWFQAKSPTKLYEYMAAGLPVVASATGEATHIIQHGQSGLLAEDAEAFVAHMRALCEDEPLRRRVSTAARKRIDRRYSLERLGERLYQAIGEVLE